MILFSGLFPDSEGMCFVWFGFLIKELDIVVAINCYSFGSMSIRKLENELENLLL